MFAKGLNKMSLWLKRFLSSAKIGVGIHQNQIAPQHKAGPNACQMLKKTRFLCVEKYTLCNRARDLQ